STFVFAVTAERTVSAATASNEEEPAGAVPHVDANHPSRTAHAASDSPFYERPLAIASAAAVQRAPALERQLPAVEALLPELDMPTPRFGVEESSTESRNWSLSLAAGAALIAALALGGAAGYQVGTGRFDDWLHWGPRPSITADPYSLGFAAHLQGSALRLEWSRTAPPIIGAVGGRVFVRSAAGEQSTALTPIELRHGIILIPVAAPEITLRLEANLPPGSRSVVETLTWRGSVPAAAAAPTMQPSN
ncbi:MAG TPA: hypothetical protein VES20_10495, partial [Bryobacteraceae bacterium]|nr:hypothetical protein [Bryobacteraceae bacterium]